MSRILATACVLFIIGGSSAFGQAPDWSARVYVEVSGASKEIFESFLIRELRQLSGIVIVKDEEDYRIRSILTTIIVYEEGFSTPTRPLAHAISFEVEKALNIPKWLEGWRDNFKFSDKSYNRTMWSLLELLATKYYADAYKLEYSTLLTRNDLRKTATEFVAVIDSEIFEPKRRAHQKMKDKKMKDKKLSKERPGDATVQ